MTQRLLRRFGGRVLTLCLLALGPAIASGAEQTDIRVLIDVSGSMKDNDPDNLRAPALRMLVGLMPAGSRSGVWTFGQYVNMQVPLAKVDERWKSRARAESHKIHSRGLFTNIEDALRRSTFDWNEPESQQRRVLILLSDGMVDVSKQDAADTRSRDRILNDILPRLRAAGVVLHTVALSQHADHELLRTLAMSTDGWYERVESAERLNRVFLRLFEKSAAADQLPLRENRFQVDAGIQDMTVVVFREAQARPTRLITPDGSAYSRREHPSTVRWHHEQRYDMVTVDKPVNGQWRIDAAADPDNRVMVVTNLQLAVSPLPNNVLRGRPVDAGARLLRDGKSLTDPDFLSMVQFGVHRSQDGQDAVLAMFDDGRKPDETAGDGVYVTKVPSAVLEPGTHELVMRAAGQTFERQHRHYLRVYESAFEVSSVRRTEAGFELDVSALERFVEAGSIRIRARSARAGDLDLPRLRRAGDDDSWVQRIPAAYAGHRITVEVRARDAGGAPLVSLFERRLPGPAVPQEASAAPAPSPQAPDPQMSEPESEPPPAPPSSGTDWAMIVLFVAAGNIVVLAAVFGVVVLWRRHRARVEAAMPSLEAAAGAGTDPVLNSVDTTGAQAGAAQASAAEADMQPDTETEPVSETEPARQSQLEAEPEPGPDGTQDGERRADEALQEFAASADDAPVQQQDTAAGASVTASDAEAGSTPETDPGYIADATPGRDDLAAQPEDDLTAQADPASDGGEDNSVVAQAGEAGPAQPPGSGLDTPAQEQSDGGTDEPSSVPELDEQLLAGDSSAAGEAPDSDSSAAAGQPEDPESAVPELDEALFDVDQALSAASAQPGVEDDAAQTEVADPDGELPGLDETERPEPQPASRASDGSAVDGQDAGMGMDNDAEQVPEPEPATNELPEAQQADTLSEGAEPDDSVEELRGQSQ